jgi:hypothetical protein
MRRRILSAVTCFLVLASSVSSASAARPKNKKAFGIQGGLSRLEPELAGTSFAGVTASAKTETMVRMYRTFPRKVVTYELGASFENRKFGASSATETWDTSYSMLLLDAMIRLKIVQILSFGVGGYWGVVLGKVTSEYPQVKLSRGPSAAGMLLVDYGIIGSARLKLPLGKSFAVTADVRYLYGIYDVGAFKTTSIKNRDLQSLFGVEFLF